MEVLYITNLPAPYKVDFFNELNNYCKLTVLFERKQASDRNKKWINENTFEFKYRFLKGIKYKAESAFCIGIVKYILSKKYDLIVVSGYSTPTGMLAIILLKLLKIQFILSCDGGIIKKDNYFVKLVKNFFISSANYYLSTGKSTNAYLENYGADINRIFIYPFTSVKEKDILEKPLNQELKESSKNKLGFSNKPLVISVGQFIYRKGYDILFELWRDFADYNLLVIGSGVEKEKYLKLIEKYENIIIMDFMNYDELKKYYQIADAFVLLTREDIWGLVVNEAMSNGIPVITTNKCVAGLEMINEGGNGFIVNSDNLNVMKSYLDIIIDSKNKENDFYLNAIKSANNYSIESMAKRHYEIFIEIMKGKEIEKK